MLIGSTTETILTISKIVIQLVGMGYSAKQATDTAKEQTGTQRLLTAQETNGIASALYAYYHTEYPELTIKDWIVYIQIGGNPRIENNQNGDTPKITNYWTYLAIFVIALMVIKK